MPSTITDKDNTLCSVNKFFSKIRSFCVITNEYTILLMENAKRNASAKEIDLPEHNIAVKIMTDRPMPKIIISKKLILHPN